MDANKAAYTAGDAIVTLSYTDTARRFKAGTLPIGEPGLLWTGPVKSNIAVPFVCSGQCTKFFNRTVNIFAAHMVSGRYGHQLVIREANADGGNGSTILEADFYTQSVQKYHYFPKPVQLAPGRALTMLCTHDLAKYTGMKRLFYGRRAENEQCAAYLHYWPMQEREKGDGSLFYCGFGFHDGRGGNLCGAGYRKDNTVATEEEGAECFPGAARVRMRDGSTREMRDLQVGDEVLVGDGGFSRVFMFTHRVKEGRFRFVQIGTNSRRVRLSAGHLLYANGMLKKAADVRVGDQLRLADGEEDEVREVTEVEADGLYNPQTVHGDIIVDGVTASCYTDAVPAKAAHALLAPLRGLLGRLAPVVSASLDGSSWRRDVGAFAFRRWRTTTQA